LTCAFAYLRLFVYAGAARRANTGTAARVEKVISMTALSSGKQACWALTMTGLDVDAITAQGHTFRVARDMVKAFDYLRANGTAYAELEHVAYTLEINMRAGVVQVAFTNGTFGVLDHGGNVLACGDTLKQALAAYAVKRGAEVVLRAGLDPVAVAAKRDGIISAAVDAGVLTTAERAAGAKYAAQPKTVARRTAQAFGANA
jgi:hypothetical protein